MTVLSLITILTAVLAPLLVYLVQRREQSRKDHVDPVTAAANAAVTMAGAVDDILHPLREQVTALRLELAVAMREIADLRLLLDQNGIALPPRRTTRMDN